MKRTTKIITSVPDIIQYLVEKGKISSADEIKNVVLSKKDNQIILSFEGPDELLPIEPTTPLKKILDEKISAFLRRKEAPTRLITHVYLAVHWAYKELGIQKPHQEVSVEDLLQLTPKQLKRERGIGKLTFSQLLQILNGDELLENEDFPLLKTED